MEELAQTELPGMVSLSEESHSAGKVKKEQPILVILGNPPYSGISANRGKWIDDLLKKGYTCADGSKDNGYYQVDGKPLGEKNPKWLQDDYVKFIRFAQWKIDQAGEGVLGFITNHSYLDNPTFRGMRQSLMNSFNQIYILDLHGNSLKKEKCPDGSKDENVFDIQQGVAIALFIKRKGEKKGRNVHHFEIWGLREEKYDWLLENDINTIKWLKLSPKSKFYLFIPREEKLLEQYDEYPKMTEIFPLNSVGMTTARDNFVIDMDKNTLLNRIRLFKNSKYSDDELHEFFQIKRKKGWSIRKAWNMLQSISDSELNKFIRPVLYRPFDVRWIFYHDSVVWRTVKRIMSHMMEDNLGLITPKQFKEEPGAFVTDTIIGHKTVSAYDINYLFPLYLCPDEDKKDLFSHKKESEGRQPNINLEFLKTLCEVYRKDLTLEEIFNYVYAVLYSTIYRTKYAEFLKTDFPRIPFTRDYKLFDKVGKRGKTLVDFHLLRSSEPDKPTAKFQGKGDNKVEKVKYIQENVYINDVQRFEGVSHGVWQYQIGGYQICNKWLKDRKGRTLSLDDIRHYCRIVAAIKNTIEIQKEIDNIYPEIEKETIEFKNPKKE
jgi:predicted helicase